jgi:DNA-binding NarL/FixJ family response regulator
MTIRVGIADDQPMIRDGFRLQVQFTDDLEFVGAAADGEQAVALARSQRPDVLLMDVRMPLIDGIEATRQIVTDPALSQVRVLVLTTFDLDEYVYGALRAGASGFLLKDTSPEDLHRAIQQVAEGGALLSPHLTRRLISEFAARPHPPADPATPTGPLTSREVEVLRLVARGLSNAELAAELVLSPLTVKTHVSRILTKLGLRDRAQLVVLAYETGIVVANHPPP